MPSWKRGPAWDLDLSVLYLACVLTCSPPPLPPPQTVNAILVARAPVLIIATNVVLEVTAFADADGDSDRDAGEPGIANAVVSGLLGSTVMSDL